MYVQNYFRVYCLSLVGSSYMVHVLKKVDDCPTNHFDSLKRTDELNAGLMCLIQSYMYLYEDGRIQ